MVKPNELEERRERFLDALTQMCVGQSAAKSIALQMEASRPAGDPRPHIMQDWSQLSQAAGVRGWASPEEARQQIKHWLGI